MTDMPSRPIWDFVHRYADAETTRMHMPGHKGHRYLGAEAWDITEIEGADSLYCPTGIIAESEANATALFGSRRTLYSCGGSSQSIFAAMWLLRAYAARLQRPPLVLAARNVHQSFVSALAQTGCEVAWYRSPVATALACPIDPAALEDHLCSLPSLPIAVYITSPDYLGNIQPVQAIADMCHRHGVLLVVDNAHGAYLRFLPQSQHPLDGGADVVCDSAHKTLCVLTGGAYLHFGARCPDYLVDNAKDAMLTVGSTSPSYLVLASLDNANQLLADPDFGRELDQRARWVGQLRAQLASKRWRTLGAEPLKLSLYAPSVGYSGHEIAALLRSHDVEPEYADRDNVVLMFSADTTLFDNARVLRTLMAVSRRAPLAEALPLPPLPPVACGVREAYLSPAEVLPLSSCEGRTLSYMRVHCPPAVPVAVAGEVLTADVLRYLAAEGYTTLSVLR